MAFNQDSPSVALTHLVDEKTRAKLISDYPLFAALVHSEIHALVKMSHNVDFGMGSLIVPQDKFVDSFFLIVSGKVEIVQNNIILAVLEHGESIGLSSQGLFSPHGRRTANAIALTDVTLLRFDIADFHEFVKNHSAFDSKLKEMAELMFKLDFIKQTYPFVHLSNEEIYSLAPLIHEISIPANAMVIKQGETDESCYMIRSGQVEIFMTKEDGSEHRLTLLEQSMMFGETALIENLPRNASARSLVDSRLLVLERSVLQSLLKGSKTFSQAMMGFMVNRFRPITNKAVIIHRAIKNEKEMVMLQNPENQQYYRLTEEGWFLWQQLDGEQTIQDLTIAFFRKYKAFAPEMICNLLYNLAETKFLSIPHITDIGSVNHENKMFPAWLKNIFYKVTHIECSLIHADRWLTPLYRQGIFVFYTLPAQIVMMMVMIVGWIAFVSSYSSIVNGAERPHFWFFLLMLILVSSFAVVLHEGAHAFTAKKLGYKVQRIGLGWIYGGPFAYVDTSELWLADYKSRLIVNVAGVYMDVFVAGCLAMGSHFMSSGLTSVYLWLLSFLVYFNALKNLSPLSANDGYFILSDILKSDRLRKLSIRWFVDNLLKVSIRRENFSNHKAECCYWLACLCYLIISTTLLFIVLQVILKLFIGASLLGIRVGYFSGAFAGFILFMSIMNMVREVKQF